MVRMSISSTRLEPAVVIFGVHRKEEVPLFEVRPATYCLSLLLYPLQCRHQNRHQQRNNSDYD